jgi:cytochrome c553
MKRRFAMSVSYRILALAALALSAGCSNIERSRSLADPQVPAQTIAQQVCSNCHGLEGRSENPKFPNLAGQPAKYLVSELLEFRSHLRLDAPGYEHMWGLSHHLTDAQLEGLAQYYAAQKAMPPARTRDATLLAEGKLIFEEGLPARSVPACKTCHGSAGEGGEDLPRLAGQHADYIEKQIIVFRDTHDRPDAVAMIAIAHEMSQRQVKAVAEFLESSEGKP